MDGPWGVDARLPRACTPPLDALASARPHASADPSFCERVLEDYMVRHGLRPGPVSAGSLARCFAGGPGGGAGMCACSDLYFYRGGGTCTEMTLATWASLGVFVTFIAVDIAVVAYGAWVLASRHWGGSRSSLPLANCLAAELAAFANLVASASATAFAFAGVNVYAFFAVLSLSDFFTFVSLLLLSVAWSTVAEAGKEDRARPLLRSILGTYSKWVYRALVVASLAATLTLFTLFGMSGNFVYYVAAKSVLICVYALFITLVIGSSLAVYRLTLARSAHPESFAQSVLRDLCDAGEVLLGCVWWRRPSPSSKDEDPLLTRVRLSLVSTTVVVFWFIVLYNIGNIMLVVTGDEPLFARPSAAAIAVVVRFTSCGSTFAFLAIIRYYARAVPSRLRDPHRSGPGVERRASDKLGADDDLLQTTVADT